MPQQVKRNVKTCSRLTWEKQHAAFYYENSDKARNLIQSIEEKISSKKDGNQQKKKT